MSYYSIHVNNQEYLLKSNLSKMEIILKLNTIFNKHNNIYYYNLYNTALIDCLQKYKPIYKLLLHKLNQYQRFIDKHPFLKNEKYKNHFNVSAKCPLKLKQQFDKLVTDLSTNIVQIENIQPEHNNNGTIYNPMLCIVKLAQKKAGKEYSNNIAKNETGLYILNLYSYFIHGNNSQLIKDYLNNIFKILSDNQQRQKIIKQSQNKVVIKVSPEKKKQDAYNYLIHHSNWQLNKKPKHNKQIEIKQGWLPFSK